MDQLTRSIELGTAMRREARRDVLKDPCATIDQLGNLLSVIFRTIAVFMLAMTALHTSALIVAVRVRPDVAKWFATPTLWLG